ncbi:MAG TPA: E3 binding domain-containing protein, partial [Arenibaculum sp.]|nr:E3 binding domain-containing protein [Arenibaculum sp.]
LVTLESDKATMEVPAPAGGTVEKLLVKVGDRVSEGSPILVLKGGEGAMTQPPSLVGQQEPQPQPQPQRAPEPAATPADRVAPTDFEPTDFGQVHASPGVRRTARELGVDLTRIKGTGEKGRITKDDVLTFLKGPSAAPATAGAGAAAAGAGIPEIPAVDFSKFGPIETKPLARI